MYVFPITFDGENMISTSLSLVNGGFEDGYRELYDPTTGEKPHHKAWVYEVDVTGGPITKRYTVERGEIHNPTGWWSWYAHQRNNNPVPWDSNNTIGWAEPETRISEPEHNRHRSGEHAGYLFTWRRIHEGGLFQQITVQSGARLRFSAYTHAWIGDDAHPPTWSLPGYGALAWQVGAPNLNDDQRSVRQYVGIDPTGGINPYADTVIWGNGWHIFNEYRSTPLTVEATAMSDTVTVFLKSSTLWPVVHNDIAWDDCSLEVIDTPIPEPDLGLPRIQYKRQYLLMHINESDEMWSQATKTMRELDVQLTLGQSADDGGIGALKDREVYAVNPAMWENNSNTLFSFYEQYYPGVKIIPIYALTPQGLDQALRRIFSETPIPEDNRGMLAYSQRNPLWANDLVGNSGKTVGMIGCAMVASCMRATRVDEILNPKVLNQRLNASGGYTNDGRLYWSEVAKVVSGLKYEGYYTWRPAEGESKPPADINKIKIELNKHPVIIQVDFKQGTPELDSHFVVAVRMLGSDDIQIIDPWTGLVGTLKGTYWNGSLENSIYAMTVYSDSEPEQEYPWSKKPRISLHNQAGLSNTFRQFLRETKPAVWKTFDTGQIPEVWQESPDTFVDYRHHLGNDHDWLNGKSASEYVARFKDALYRLKDYPQVQRGLLGAESINEVMAGSDIPRAVVWDVDFINVMARELPFIRPIVATIPVGNVEYSELPWLDPLIQASKNGWPVWGYHNYYPAYEGESYLVQDWIDYSGRFERIHEHALTKGIKLFWLFGETGAITRLPGGHMPPEEGWKHPRCLVDNWQKYLQDLTTMNTMLKNHRYSNQIIGATMFTVGNMGWEYFQLTDEQIMQLAQAIK